VRRAGGSLYHASHGWTGYPKNTVAVSACWADSRPIGRRIVTRVGTTLRNASGCGYGTCGGSGSGGHCSHSSSTHTVKLTQILDQYELSQRPRMTPPPGTLLFPLGRHVSAPTFLIDIRALYTCMGLLCALLVVGLAGLSLGTAPLTPGQAMAGLLGKGDSMHVFVVRQLRLSRLVAGALTGAALGLSGCLMQTVARNRLATPGIIGIENGATMFAIASVLGTVPAVMRTAMALIGAVTATALAFALAGGLGTQGYRFIVAGIGVGAALRAVTQLLMARAPIDSANAAWAWTVGSLNAPNTTAVYLLMAGFSLCLPAALLLGRSLTLLRFSDNVARSLGIDVTRCRRQALGLAVVLCGLSVAVAGPVGLIALMGPEIARFLSSRRR